MKDTGLSSELILRFRCNNITGRNANNIDLLTLCNISPITMLEQSIVSFKIKSNKVVKSGKNTFRLIAAAGLITLIVYLIIQKCEQDIFKRIFDGVCIMYICILLVLHYFCFVVLRQ